MTDFIGYYLLGLAGVFVLMIIVNPDFWQSLRNSYFADKMDINKDIDEDIDSFMDNKELKHESRRR